MAGIDTPLRTAKEQFDRQATHYDAQWNQWTEESLAWLLGHATPKTTDHVLDVATGTGFTALGFAPHVQWVTGLDVSTGMLEQARRRASEQRITNVTFVEGAAELLPFPDASFDLVTCRIAPHHFLSVPRFLAETNRVLRPEGRVALADTTVPADSTCDAWQNRVETLRDPSHVRNYTRTEWERFVIAAGFTLAVVEDASGGIAITLNDWLVKAGCSPDQSDAVRREFAKASTAVERAFHIERLAANDIGFTWQRIAFVANKQ